MTDEALLLNQLRLDREEPVAGLHAARRTWLMLSGSAVGLAVAVLAVMRFVAVPAEELQSGVAVAEVAPPASLTPSAAPVASILDASGYVVARRQATVSAKITGKVAAVLIEEGAASRSGRSHCPPRRRERAGASRASGGAGRAATREPCGGAGRIRQRGPDVRAPPRAVRGRVHQCADVRRRQGELRHRASEIWTSRAARWVSPRPVSR